MFEKYLNKKVRVLVSTGSGAGISNGEMALGTIYNPIITVVGTLNNIESGFIEIINSRMIYYETVANTFSGREFDNSRPNGPDVMENESTLLSLDKVIAISLIRENK